MTASLRSSLICLLAAVFLTGAAKTHSAADSLRQRLHSIKTITADFTQTVTRNYQDQQQLASNTSGKMWVAKPNRFRWQTKQPDNQLIVADGQALWIYDQDLEQVTVQKLSQQLQDVPLLLFSGDGEQLQDTYQVSTVSVGPADKLQDVGADKPRNVENVRNVVRSDKQTTYVLQARDPSALVRTITITFEQDTLKTLVIDDSTGAVTKISLQRSQQNQNLSPSLFKFKAPQGVDVIGSAHQ